MIHHSRTDIFNQAGQQDGVLEGLVRKVSGHIERRGQILVGLKTVVRSPMFIGCEDLRWSGRPLSVNAHSGFPSSSIGNIQAFTPLTTFGAVEKRVKAYWKMRDVPGVSQWPYVFPVDGGWVRIRSPGGTSGLGHHDDR